jgi:hypothetical protein
LRDYADFCLEFPAWVGPDGDPISWRHYIYGTAAIQRAKASEKMRMADAVAVHKSKEQTFKKWLREHSALAGH